MVRPGARPLNIWRRGATAYIRLSAVDWAETNYARSTRLMNVAVTARDLEIWVTQGAGGPARHPSPSAFSPGPIPPAG